MVYHDPSTRIAADRRYFHKDNYFYDFNGVAANGNKQICFSFETKKRKKAVIAFAFIDIVFNKLIQLPIKWSFRTDTNYKNGAHSAISTRTGNKRVSRISK
jgi:hypothetical protein